VFVALDEDGTPPDLQGAVLWYIPDGSLRRKLKGPSNGQASSVAFDRAGNLYVPHWCLRAGGNGNCLSPNNTVERWDANGNFQRTFGSGYNCNPSSMAFDAAGNMYVGQADCTGDILKFDAAGNLVGTFDVFTPPPDGFGHGRGTDHIDLARDGCTIFYTSRTRHIYRYNVCTREQLNDDVRPWNTQLLPGETAYHLVILPDGGVLVADSQVIVRLDASGNQMQTYIAPGETNFWGGVDYVDSTSFWATNAATDNVFRFDLQTGAVLARFNTGTGGLTAAGVGVRR